MTTFQNHSDVLIIGGSVAATRAAEAITQLESELSVTILSNEAYLPYERPPLSKIGLDAPLDLGPLVYPNVATLAEQGVSFLLDHEAQHLDVERQTVTTNHGDYTYRALVVANGCEPFVPPMFQGLQDVHTLRHFDDATALRQAVSDESKTIAVIGGGFIGGEFASTLLKAGKRVSIVDIAPQPLGRFGHEASHLYEQLHTSAGANLHFGEQIENIRVNDGKARELVLSNGDVVPADIILLGVGVRPSTGWLRDSELQNLENGILCDENLQAGPNIFAAGDIAHWPNPQFGKNMRIEHWTTAAQQGRSAGLNAAKHLLGQAKTPCSVVPYFWSDQQGVRIQFAGYLTGGENTFSLQLEDGNLVLYVDDNEKVLGVLTFGVRALFPRIRAGLRKGLLVPDVEALIGTKIQKSPANIFELKE